jgi:hypothetical protein
MQWEFKIALSRLALERSAKEFADIALGAAES